MDWLKSLFSEAQLNATIGTLTQSNFMAIDVDFNSKPDVVTIDDYTRRTVMKVPETNPYLIRGVLPKNHAELFMYGSKNEPQYTMMLRHQGQSFHRIWHGSKRRKRRTWGRFKRDTGWKDFAK